MDFSILLWSVSLSIPFYACAWKHHIPFSGSGIKSSSWFWEAWFWHPHELHKQTGDCSIYSAHPGFWQLPTTCAGGASTKWCNSKTSMAEAARPCDFWSEGTEFGPLLIRELNITGSLDGIKQQDPKSVANRTPPVELKSRHSGLIFLRDEVATVCVVKK